MGFKSPRPEEEMASRSEIWKPPLLFFDLRRVGCRAGQSDHHPVAEVKLPVVTTSRLDWWDGRSDQSGNCVAIKRATKAVSNLAHRVTFADLWPFAFLYLLSTSGRPIGVLRLCFYHPSANRVQFDIMCTFQGYRLIRPEDLAWRPSNKMKIPNADFLERTKSENLSARLWRLPPWSANTLHKHIRQEEFYFVLEGVGRIRIGDETLSVPRHGGVLVGPEQLRQVFNDTESEVLWLIVGAPEETEVLPAPKPDFDFSLLYPVDPTQLPKELDGIEWPPKS